MAAGLATLPVPLHASGTCSGLKSSVEFAVCHARRLQRHGVSGRPPLSSLMNHRRCRNVFTVIPCQHTRLASALVSKSSSPGPVWESEDAVVDSESSSPHAQTPIVRGAEANGEIDVYATALGGFGLLLACALQFPEAAVAATESGFPTVMTFAGAEPSNALSLPTWVIHVASVVEWLTAMALIWKYGDMKGKSAWKGLTWGMVPLLGGAMCACTWHFFYNAESLEVLVVLQAFLTVVGNCTMWAAAYRIWKLSQEEVTVD